MAVHQLKDGRWYIDYRVKGTEKLKREYFGRGLEAEARARERFAEIGVNEYYRHRTPKRKEIATFKELAREYLIAKTGTIKDSSLSALIYKLTGIIFPEIGDLPVARLTHYRMDQYKNKRLDTPVTVIKSIGGQKKRIPVPGRFVKATTVHREIADIQAIINWAVRRKIILRNPLDGYEKPERDDEITIPPTEDEIMALMQHVSPHLDRALTISYYTGLRPGRSELLGITWDQVDFKARTIFIISAKKKGPRTRTLPLHPDFYEALKKWEEEDKAEKKTAREIITYRGNPVKRISKAFTAAKKRAGITRRLRPYDFRHNFATDVLEDGADLKATSEFVGHSRTDTTTKTYQHTNFESLKKVIEKRKPMPRKPAENHE